MLSVSLRRSFTPATGATWGCCSSRITADAGLREPIATRRWRAPIRTTASSRISRTRRTRSSATRIHSMRSGAGKGEVSRQHACPRMRCWARSTISRWSASPITSRTAGVWYRLLNTGLRIPAGAGSDTMAQLRLAARAGRARARFSIRAVSARRLHCVTALKQGRTFVEQCAAARPRGWRVCDPGDTLHETRGRQCCLPGLDALARADRALELVHNGKVVESFALQGDRRKLDASGSVRLDRGGWVRAARLERRRGSAGVRWLSVRHDQPGLSRSSGQARDRGAGCRVFRRVAGSRDRDQLRGPR